MMNGWPTARLGDLAEVGAGNSAPQDKSVFTDGSYPFFRTADAGRIRFGDIYESTDYLNASGIRGLRRYPKGTILFPKSGASTFLNHRVMLGVDGYVTSHLATIVADETHIDRRFLLYFLSTISAQDLIQDHAYPSLNLPMIADIVVPKPPIAEQQRIVGLLDGAFAGIATAKANSESNLRNAHDLFDSHLQSVFNRRGVGWVEKPLGEIAEFKNGLNYNKNSMGQTLPVVGVADFQDNYYVPHSELDSATIDGKLAENYAVQRDDILTVRSNGSKHLVGRCMLVADIDEMVSYSGFIIRIRFDTTKLYPEYLLHFMKCQATRDILTQGGGGANITNINQERLASLLVPFPSYPAQKHIAVALDALREDTQRLGALYARKLAALDALKRSLLNQAFSANL